MTTEHRFAPASGPISQVLWATAPLVVLYTYFLWEAYCQHMALENDEDQVAEEELVEISDMVLVFMVVAQAWSILAVYISVFVPKRHELLRQYLTNGEPLLGDVHYQSKTSCAGLRRHHYGYIMYPHPRGDIYPVYIRRQVNVLEYYTREKTTILVLPKKPFSGQPKADLELDLAAANRNLPKLRMLALISWTWLLVSVGAPLYLLLVMDQLELHSYHRYTWINWMSYSIYVGVVLPLIAFGLNGLVWTHHKRWMTTQGKIAEEGENPDGSGLGWFDVGGDDFGYEPPTPQTSSDDEDGTVLVTMPSSNKR